jgi:hypothetical protein
MQDNEVDEFAADVWRAIDRKNDGAARKYILARDSQQRAQGRREAAEAYCKGCSCMGPCDRQKTCVQYNAILETASDEKTDKGEI